MNYLFKLSVDICNADATLKISLLVIICTDHSMAPLCRINGGPFEEEKPLLSSRTSHDLEDEEAEELCAEEDEGEESEKPSGKPDSQSPRQNLSDDAAQEEMENDLNLNCKTSPRR